MIRFCDIIFSFIGLFLFFPIFLIIALLIKLESSGSIFYKQERIGRNGISFKLFKFRSMQIGSDKKGLITIGNNDNRVTRVGVFLRKNKLDELPQLINVLKGEMSFVGPRPEVNKYTQLYSQHQKQVLSVLPGITDYASIYFRSENELLASVSNPEEYYIKFILPQKIRFNLIYIKNKSLFQYFRVIIITSFKILKLI